jgi:hypothetical protein
MIGRPTRLVLAGVIAAASLAAFASTASASFHLNLIREVHEGNGATGDYVELQATAPGQNFVSGKHIVSYDGGGGILTDYTIPTNVSNGANQATILISSGPLSGADFVAGTGGTGAGNLNVDNTGGTVCFGDSATVAIDCVAFAGNNGLSPTMFPTPPPSPYGTPFALPGAAPNAQLGPNQSLIRTISRGCATQLDAADDTNNSAADFSLGAGTPRSNSTTPTETPCPATPTAKKKCKKHKKKTGGYSAKKTKCKKKKH